jgi:hypothetical protein
MNKIKPFVNFLHYYKRTNLKNVAKKLNYFYNFIFIIFKTLKSNSLV